MSLYDEGYFQWLCTQIHIQNNSTRSFTELFWMLHHKEFVWHVPNDDNRIVDAEDLRREFWGEGRMLPRNGVSILEVIIALSRRLEFNAGGNQEVWAWTLIKNLGLSRMHDPLAGNKRDQVDSIMENLIWRNYEKDGKGGFFPLRNPREDQTKVEIWYQMSAYINERV